MHDPVTADPTTPSTNLSNSLQAAPNRRGKHSATRVVPSQPVVPQYITEEELSRMTTLSRSGLQAMRARGEGPPYARLGHRIVYRLADVECWIDARTQRVENGL
jgi:predicted DNA-binding transcriptional regulator AlpA